MVGIDRIEIRGTEEMGLRFQLKAMVGKQLLARFYRKQISALGATRHLGPPPLRLPYLLIDRGHPDTLVNLHGFTDRKESFLLCARGLVDSFNLVLPDLPGFGENERAPSHQHTMDHYTQSIVDLISDLGRRPVWLCGNSLGGAVASRVAFDRPELVRVVLPVSPTLYYNDGDNPLFEEFSRGENLFLIHSEADYSRYIDRIFHQRPDPIPFVSDALLSDMMRKRDWYNKLAEDLLEGASGTPAEMMDAGRFLNGRLRDGVVPMHFLWGEHDALFPSETIHGLRRLRPDFRYTTIPGSGHCPHLEAPRRLAAAICETRDWLESPAVSPGPGDP